MLTLLRPVAVCLCLLVSCWTLGWADPPKSEEGPRGWQQIQHELNLSAEQMHQMRPIMETYRQSCHSRFDDLRSRIRSLLTPEQKKRFDILRDEHSHNANATPRRHGLQELTSQLGLSGDQVKRVTEMVRDCRQQWRSAHEELLGQLRPILTAEQFARFQEITRRRHRETADPVH